MKLKEQPRPTISDRIGSAFDGIINVFSPERAHRRQAFRHARQILLSHGGYRAASRNKLRREYNPGGGSADQDILPDLETLRDRSRDLVRNNGYASGIIGTMNTNVISSGIVPQCRVDAEALGISEEQANDFIKVTRRVWERYVPFADAGARNDVYEIQSQIVDQILENGEVIVLPLRIDRPGRPYKLAWQVIEADRLETPIGLVDGKFNGLHVRAGVEIGEVGEPVAYWIKNTHPGDFRIPDPKNDQVWTRIPALNRFGQKNIFHLYFQKRPGQTRGVPFFAPVMNYFKDIGDYMEAELIASRIAACFAIFITKEDPGGAAGGNSSETTKDGERLEEFSPGIVEYLKPGEKLESFKPDRPGSNFEPFITTILRQISSSLNLSYEAVSKDFSGVNYSSARAALLEARKFFRQWQQWITRKFNQPALELLYEEAFLVGDLGIGDFFADAQAWCRTEWMMPGWEWIDPKREMEAAEIGTKSGIITLADTASSRGKDWEAILEQQSREKKRRKELELADPATLDRVTVSTDPVPKEEINV